MKKLLLALALSMLGGTAFAACTNPLNVKDAASATITMSVIAGADTFCQYSFNLANVGGNAPLTGNGATGTGSLRVTMSNDNTVPTGWPTAANQTAASAARGEGATGAAVPSGAVYVGRNSAGNLVGWDGSVTQSGTWTFQPGNTPNTTPWLASVSQGGNTAVVKAANTVATTDVGLVVAVANTLAPGQAALASSSPVAIAKNSGTGSTVAGAAVGTAGTASAEVVTVQGIASMTPILSRPSDGTRNAVLDACEANAQTSTPISITTATTTRIVAPSASNKTYICALFLTSAAADNVGIVEGTGGTCGTATAGVIGGTTAANGPNFAANGGMFIQAGGKTAVAVTAGTNVDLCLITSAATPLAGVIKFVQAP